MINVNKTLYIPLFGKAYVSRKGVILSDKKAEEIWAAEGFDLKGKSKSKWLAYYMGMRSAVFDEWLKERMAENENAAVIHIGCGMDSRVLRVGTRDHKWYDIDFAEVIEERKRYFSENADYKMIVGDARDGKWLEKIPENSAIVVMEGVSMYLTGDEINGLTAKLCEKFDSIALMTDCYTTLAAKLSKYKNPINDVGVTKVYGIDDPTEISRGELIFIKEHSLTPQKYIDELVGIEKRIFKKLYAGKFAKKLYRLFEYKNRKNDQNI